MLPSKPHENTGWLLTSYAATRDEKMPLDEFPNDIDLDNGCQCIPVSPPNDGYGEWSIYDTSKDYKTGWLRFRTTSNPVGDLPAQGVSYDE